MTNEELIAYFKNKALPETLRLDRASTQIEVKAAVQRNIQTLMAEPGDVRANYRLAKIMNALETPYSGPEIPRL
jgi:molybdenum cofactor biosynthesis enzyme